MSDIISQYHRMLEAVQQAAAEAGRKPGAVRLLAVSKTFPAEDIAALYECGCREFGESRIQELEVKSAALPGDIVWHFIGQLQANKARKAVKLAQVIHSVDSVPLIQRLNRIAGEEGRCPEILLEVNVSGEASKSGLSPDELEAAAEAADAAEHLNWRGFMTVAPEAASESELRRIFGALECMRRKYAEKYRRALPELSMGMSGDFSAAIDCGATLVRIGTAVFGRRDYSAPSP